MLGPGAGGVGLVSSALPGWLSDGSRVPTPNEGTEEAENEEGGPEEEQENEAGPARRTISSHFGKSFAATAVILQERPVFDDACDLPAALVVELAVAVAVSERFPRLRRFLPKAGRMAGKVLPLTVSMFCGCPVLNAGVGDFLSGCVDAVAEARLPSGGSSIRSLAFVALLVVVLLAVLKQSLVLVVLAVSLKLVPLISPVTLLVADVAALRCVMLATVLLMRLPLRVLVLVEGVLLVTLHSIAFMAVLRVVPKSTTKRAFGGRPGGAGEGGESCNMC